MMSSIRIAQQSPCDPNMSLDVSNCDITSNMMSLNTNILLSPLFPGRSGPNNIVLSQAGAAIHSQDVCVYA